MMLIMGIQSTYCLKGLSPTGCNKSSRRFKTFSNFIRNNRTGISVDWNECETNERHYLPHVDQCTLRLTPETNCQNLSICITCMLARKKLLWFTDHLNEEYLFKRPNHLKILYLVFNNYMAASMSRGCDEMDNKYWNVWN